MSRLPSAPSGLGTCEWAKAITRARVSRLPSAPSGLGTSKHEPWGPRTHPQSRFPSAPSGLGTCTTAWGKRSILRSLGFHRRRAASVLMEVAGLVHPRSVSASIGAERPRYAVLGSLRDPRNLVSASIGAERPRYLVKCDPIRAVMLSRLPSAPSGLGTKKRGAAKAKTEIVSASIGAERPRYAICHGDAEARRPRLGFHRRRAASVHNGGKVGCSWDHPVSASIGAERPRYA